MSLSQLIDDESYIWGLSDTHDPFYYSAPAFLPSLKPSYEDFSVKETTCSTMSEISEPDSLEPMYDNSSNSLDIFCDKEAKKNIKLIKNLLSEEKKILKIKWKPKEDAKLLEMHKIFGDNWRALRQYTDNKTSEQIKHRIQILKKS